MNYMELFRDVSNNKYVVIDSTDKNVIGEHMYYNCKQNNIPLNKSKKLIGSMFGEKICMLTPQIKWDLEHGFSYN